MDITKRHRSAPSRVFRRYLALARMWLAPERGSNRCSRHREHSRSLAVLASSFFQLTCRQRRFGVLELTTTSGQVVLPKCLQLTFVVAADVPVLPYSTKASRHAGSSDVSRREGVTLLNVELFYGVVARLSRHTLTAIERLLTDSYQLTVSYLV